MCAAAIPAVALNFVFDSMQSIQSGLLKGLGEQGKAAWASLAGNILIGMPLSYVFGIVANMGLIGFFLGIFIGNLVINAFYAYIAVSRDWTEIAKRVSKTMAIK